jgi:hypothetical protein
LVLKPHHRTRQKNEKLHHRKGGGGGGEVEAKNLAGTASKEYEWLITSTGVLHN